MESATQERIVSVYLFTQKKAEETGLLWVKIMSAQIYFWWPPFSNFGGFKMGIFHDYTGNVSLDGMVGRVGHCVETGITFLTYSS